MDIKILEKILDLIIPALLLLFTIGAIAGIVEALIKTWNSSDTSFGMLRLRRYAISASVAIVGFFASIVCGGGFGGRATTLLIVSLILALLIFLTLTIMFFWLMGDTLGHKKRFRWVYLLSTVSIVVVVIFWTLIGYQQNAL